MSAYLELHIKGNGCAIVDASMIGAVIAKGHDAWKVGTPDRPTLIVLKSGETLEIIDSSPGGVIGRMVNARQIAAQMKREVGAEVYVDWLNPLKDGAEDAADGQPFRA